MKKFLLSPIIWAPVSFLALGGVSTAASIFSAIPGLSTAAKDSLVAHYDGRTGVATTGTTVNSWTPVDGNDNPLPDRVIHSTARGAGAPELIRSDGAGELIFDDTAVGADGRYLLGDLFNAAGDDFTVIWLGHYDDEAPLARSGTYAYNLGPNIISHQRDDAGGGYVIELYNGTTYAGDDITAYDGKPTAWSTVVTASTQRALANGTDLNVSGAPSGPVPANAQFIVGAFGGSGYDFVGSIRQILIFSSALDDTDRGLIEAHLLSLVDNPTTDGPATDKPTRDLELIVENGTAELSWDSERHLLSSTDLTDWRLVPEAASPMVWETEAPQQFFVATDTFEKVPAGCVLRTRISSDTWRDLEYHVDTGELYLLGEQGHGFDHYTSGGNDLWWCYMNSSNAGNGLLEFLTTRNLDAATMQSTAVAAGWTSYGTATYQFLTLEPLAAHNTWVNDEAPTIPGGEETTEYDTDDYHAVDASGITYVLYRNTSSGTAYIGLGGPGLLAAAGFLPPGDGTAQLDNGVRGDVAFKTIVPLSAEDKLALINRFQPVIPTYQDASKPYPYEHPPGL